MSRSAQRYKLCQRCFVREGGGPGLEIVEGPQCWVCSGLLDQIPALARKALTVARRYDFDTFAVGVSLPGAVQEREDELRSELRLKGNETVKTQASRLVAAELSSRLRKRVDRYRPDLTLLVSLGDGQVSASARPLYYYARYTKPPGVSQRREFCSNCGGTGCARCRGTGFERKPSVEALVRERLGKITGSDRSTFTWMGSEDRESRVFPPGRPFIVEVKSPVKRIVPKAFLARSKPGQVSVSMGRVLSSKPVRLPSFRFSTTIQASAARKPAREDVDGIRIQFRRREVRFQRPHDRPTTKTVYRAEARAKGRRLTIDAVLDGGLPVKRFVSGELVSPSVSEVLKTEVRCRTFDIREVKETGKLELAEVAWLQKKN